VPTRMTLRSGLAMAGTLVPGILALHGCTLDLSTLLWPERAPAQLTLADVFQDPVVYPLDRVANSLRLADLDGDGRGDLVFLADPNSTALGVLHRGADGFDSATYTELERGWMSVTPADLDGDDTTDLVLADYTQGVAMLPGRGDGTFEDLRHLASGTQFPNVVLPADLDLDGDVDLAIVYFSAQDVSVSLNVGGGHFAWPRFYEALLDQSFGGAVTDLDGDGFPDLLVIGKQAAPGSFFRNRGDGTFAPAVAFASDVPRIADVVPADVDGDGNLDLLAGSYDGIFLLHNEGGGTLAPAVSIYPAASLTLLAVDFTGDGAPDLVTDFGLLVNNGDGTFGPLIDLGVTFRPNSVVAGDVNGDGLPDLAGLANGGVTILLGRGPRETAAP
jgi:hypothetical protein